jgi:hypothetical protein
MWLRHSDQERNRAKPKCLQATDNLCQCEPPNDDMRSMLATLKFLRSPLAKAGNELRRKSSTTLAQFFRRKPVTMTNLRSLDRNPPASPKRWAWPALFPSRFAPPAPVHRGDVLHTRHGGRYRMTRNWFMMSENHTFSRLPADMLPIRTLPMKQTGGERSRQLNETFLKHCICEAWGSSVPAFIETMFPHFLDKKLPLALTWILCGNGLVRPIKSTTSSKRG